MTVSKPLSTIRSLTTAQRSALKKAGIDNTGELLQATTTKDAEKALAKKAGISVTAVREAAHRADLLQVQGLGAARADLFENAGVTSTAKLAQENATAMRAILEKFAKAHPELNVHLPNPKTIASLIDKAKQVGAVTPPDVDEAQARKIAGDALNEYIDKVLFSDDPAGKSFRDAILSWRPPTEWPTVQKQMHDDVATFVQTAEKSTDPQIPGSFWFSGSLFKLYTDVKIDKTGKVLQAFVEID